MQGLPRISRSPRLACEAGGRGGGVFLAVRSVGVLLAALALPSLAVGAPVTTAVANAPAPPAERRWTDATPDRMIDDAVARSLAVGAHPAPEADVVAAALTIAELDERALYGHAKRALEGIASSVKGEMSAEGALLARTLAADEGSKAGAAADAKLGVVTKLVHPRPFPRHGRRARSRRRARGQGRFVRRSGDALLLGDGRRRLARGPAVATPRLAACRSTSSSIRARRAARGSPRASPHCRHAGDRPPGIERERAARRRRRLTWARAKTCTRRRKLDCLAVRVTLGTGAHLIAAKVCTGALDDDGRVRLRVEAEGAAQPPRARVGSPAACRASPSRRRRGSSSASTLRSRGRSPRRRRPATPSSTSPSPAPSEAPTTSRAPAPPASSTPSRIRRTLDADRLAMAGWSPLRREPERRG